MRATGTVLEHIRKVGRLWLLLLIPAAFLALPFVLLSLMTGKKMFSYVSGPANIFKATYEIPATAELAGTYRLADASRDSLGKRGIVVAPSPTIQLAQDHALEVREVPAFNLDGSPRSCRLNGRGRWSAAKTDNVVQLSFDLTSSESTLNDPSICASESVGLVELLGRQSPYKIWYVVGEPEAGFGLAFVKQ